MGGKFLVSKKNSPSYSFIFHTYFERIRGVVRADMRGMLLALRVHTALLVILRISYRDRQ